MATRVDAASSWWRLLVHEGRSACTARRCRSGRPRSGRNLRRSGWGGSPGRSGGGAGSTSRKVAARWGGEVSVAGKQFVVELHAVVARAGRLMREVIDP